VIERHDMQAERFKEKRKVSVRATEVEYGVAGREFHQSGVIGQEAVEMAEITQRVISIPFEIPRLDTIFRIPEYGGKLLRARLQQTRFARQTF
jgi:hypothetical protein